MASLVLNEWLWSDLSGENGVAKQRQTAAFLAVLAESNDQIVVVGGSNFDIKAWKLCKSSDLCAKEASRVFMSAFRFNSQKCRLLGQNDVRPLLDPLGRLVNVDDHYLVQASVAVPGSTIITSDMKLLAVLRQQGVASEDRDTFVNQYLV